MLCDGPRHDMKACAKCRVEKEDACFGKRGLSLRSRCRVCRAEDRKLVPTEIKKKWQATNKVTRRGKPREQDKTYRALNAETISARIALWASTNRERRAEQAKLRYTKNKTGILANQKLYAKNNPAKMNAQYAKRRAQVKKACPAWAQPEAIASFYVSADALNMLTGEWHEVDHIVPLLSKKVCGLHVENNLQILSKFGNRSKGNRFWPDMFL